MTTDHDTEEINLPCARCGAEVDEPCSEECLEQDSEARTERMIEKVLAKRDEQWHNWLEAFAVTIHREFKELGDRVDARVDRLAADLSLVENEARRHGAILALVSTLPPAAE